MSDPASAYRIIELHLEALAAFQGPVHRLGAAKQQRAHLKFAAATQEPADQVAGRTRQREWAFLIETRLPPVIRWARSTSSSQ